MHEAPGLVVEILSPSSGSIDRVKKPRRYKDFGVPEYWVVDPEERAVWVWRFAAGAEEAERVEGRLIWNPEGAASALELQTDVRRVLERLHRPRPTRTPPAPA